MWHWNSAKSKLTLQVIGSQITLVLTLTDIYVFITGAETDPHTGIPLDPERWWHPVFHLAMVTVVAVLILTRVCNSSAFWIAAFVFNMGFFISTFTDGVMMGVKTRNDGYSVNWGFPTRNEWTRNFSWMMFTGLPFKVLSVDCPAQ